MTNLLIALSLTSARAAENVGVWIIETPVSATFLTPLLEDQWMNSVNIAIDPADGLLSSPVWNQGYGNASQFTEVDFTYAGAVENGPGHDLAIFEAFYIGDRPDYTITTDHDAHVAGATVPATDFVDVGATYLLYVNYTGPFEGAVYGALIDLSDAGVPDGVSVDVIRMRTDDDQGDPLSLARFICTDDDIDSVCNEDDLCPGHDDRLDTDGDHLIDGCDACPKDPEPSDDDHDGVCDGDDACPGHPDSDDVDIDGLPDECDACPDDPAPSDADGDGSCDADDLCPGEDDHDDPDGDGVPSGCDTCPTDAPPDDDDLDGVCDADDACPGENDTLDGDGDGAPDACDPCPVDAAPNDDVDGDGSCNANDLCPGEDDGADLDLDTVPDACDPCPADALDDSDGDGSCDSDDVCPGFDDLADGDADGLADGCDACPMPGDTDADADGACPPTDCNDANDSVFPGADEGCNGLDDDCDGFPGIEEADADGDGLATCEGDCDDGDADAFPGATDTCGDAIDQDCDGRDTPCTDPLQFEPIEEEGGCNCDNSGAPRPWALSSLVLLAGLRRRHRRS